ncbi:CBS domain-containing protein [Halococcoides cellulosivorans]|uniref:Transcriptional regulator n=1 Tax=Halococcoides cellulosivorans TaxID=1679096 RepID=A0A2R4WZI5_9EURY|nr:CBS domain-containing protein [Halococcoides cellulosivorans]AWB26950.1 transcriptional regulator [Halococcoides cellulosivorans]
MNLPTPDDLRERRTDLELTQSELADRADVSQPLIARIEGGDVDPRLSTLRRIVEALDAVEGSILRAEDLMHSPVVSVEPDDSVHNAKQVMDEKGYSQVPVIRDGTPKGLIGNYDIRQHSDDDVGKLPVQEVMHESITTVEPSATVEEIDTYLDHHDAVLVVEDGATTGIITDADIAAHVS